MQKWGLRVTTVNNVAMQLAEVEVCNDGPEMSTVPIGQCIAVQQSEETIDFEAHLEIEEEMGDEYPEFLAPTTEIEVSWRENLYKYLPGDLPPECRDKLD